MTTGKLKGHRGVRRKVRKIKGEWLQAVDSKSTVSLWHWGFESLPLRYSKACLYGEVRERSNRRAWRARGRQKCPVGSNPTLSTPANNIACAEIVDKGWSC